MGTVRHRAATLLCVEGHSEARELLARLLVPYELVFAPTAFDAISNINKGVFDLYLLDYWVPGWSGIELCREIRRADPHGPILFCTAAKREIERARALRAGASDYLTKPVDPKLLCERVAVLLKLAARESARARTQAHEALIEELNRRLAHASIRDSDLRYSAASVIERGVKAKAHRSFIDSKGACAHFHRWWPDAFARAWASASIEAQRATQPVPGVSIKGSTCAPMTLQR